MTADGSDTCQCGHERAQHRWVRGAYWSGCNACECWFFLRPATVVLNWTGYEVVDGMVMSPAVAKAYRSWRSDDGEDDQ